MKKLNVGDIVLVRVNQFSDFYPVVKNNENWEISFSYFCEMQNNNNVVMIVELEPIVDFDHRIDGFICMHKFEFWFCPHNFHPIEVITCAQK